MKKYRKARIEKEIARVLGRIIQQELKNKKLKGLVSVTQTEITNDLKEAKVYVTVMQKKDQDPLTEEDIRQEFQKSSGFLRKRLSQEIKLRITPKLDFRLDTGIKHSAKINKILKEIKSN
ncbi:MAG: 30S ribosome-binding factor RbfA [Fusobacteriota bacterium]